MKLPLNFSLRWLLGLVVFLCLILGGREAYRSYHWHRNLPVEFALANSQSPSRAPFSLEARIRFDRENANRVRAETRKQRERQIDELVDNLKNGKFGVVGRWSLGPKSRALFQQRLRTSVLQHPGKPGFGMIGSWLESQDPRADEYISEQIESGDSSQLVELLEKLDDQVSWPIDDERFQKAVIRRLRAPLVSIRLVQWVLRNRFDFAVAAVAELLATPERIEFDDQLLALNWFFGIEVFTESWLRALHFEARVEGVAELAKTKGSETYLLAIFQALRSEVKNNFGGVNYQGFRFTRILHLALSRIAYEVSDRANYGQVDQAAIDQLARYFYSQNSLSSFLFVADRRHEKEVDWIFQNRHTLMGGDYRPYWVVDLAAALPYPISGFEEPCIDWLLSQRLVTMDREFADPRLLTLMEEGWGHALDMAGYFWHGTENAAALEILIPRYQQLFASAVQMERQFSSAPLSQQNETELQEVHELFRQAEGVFDVIHSISPASTTRLPQSLQRVSTVSHFQNIKSNKSSQVDELVRILKRFQLHPVAGERFLEDIFLHAMIRNHRCSLPPRWYNKILTSHEQILNASKGIFEPEVLVRPVRGEEEVYSVEVAVENRIYEFEIKGRNDCWVYQLCDIYNHILEREGVEWRFVFEAYSADRLYFGAPEMFQELVEQLDWRWAEGSEFYFSHNN